MPQGMTASETRAVVADEKKAEAQHQKELKEAEKHSFSFSLSGTKEGATKQLGTQVKDSGVASAIKAIISAAPGNALSLAGTMESAVDGSKGTIEIHGNFESLSEEVLKTSAATEKQRNKR
jgi:hypothetical protein